MGNHRIVKQHKDGRRAETTRERERERERERGGENKNTRTWSAHERGNPSWQALGFPKHQRDCVPRSGKGFHYPGWARTVIPSSYAFLPLDGVSSFSPLCSHRPSSTPVLPPPQILYVQPPLAIYTNHFHQHDFVTHPYVTLNGVFVITFRCSTL